MFHTCRYYFIRLKPCFIPIGIVSCAHMLFPAIMPIYIVSYLHMSFHICDNLFHTNTYCFIPTHVISDEMCVTKRIVLAFINNSA